MIKELSPSQLKFFNWYLHGGRCYEFVDIYILEGNIDINKFERAIDNVVSHHDILKCEVVLRNGFGLIECKDQDLSKVFNLEYIDNTDIESVISKEKKEKKGYLGPVTYFKLYKFPMGRSLFVIRSNILGPDGVSRKIILDSISRFYNEGIIEKVEADYFDYLKTIDYYMVDLLDSFDNSLFDFKSKRLIEVKSKKLSVGKKDIKKILEYLDLDDKKSIGFLLSLFCISVSKVLYDSCDSYILLSSRNRNSKKFKNVVGCLTDVKIFDCNFNGFLSTDDLLVSLINKYHNDCDSKYNFFNFGDVKLDAKGWCDLNNFPIIFSSDDPISSDLNLNGLICEYVSKDEEEIIWPLDVSASYNSETENYDLDFLFSGVVFKSSQISKVIFNIEELLSQYKKVIINE